MKNKNLLILCPSFPDKESQFYGGIFVKEYINSIKKYFNKVYVISPIPSIFLFKTKKENVCKNYKYDNVEIYYPRHFHLPIKFFRDNIGNNQFKVVDNLIQKLNLKFDIIHSHFIWPSGYVGVKLKEKYGKKIIITIHENKDWFFSQIKKEKNILIIKKVDFLVRVNSLDILLLKKYNNNTFYIPNGYNEDDFFYIENKKQLRLELNVKDNKKILLSVGNLVKQKNHKLLILACKELLKARDDFICYIIGEGVLRKDLEKLINKNNLQNYVKLLGRKNHKDIAKYINISDLFILPSTSESFGVVQVEAMACGVPVIATVNGGSEEIIKDDNLGFLLENNNDYKGLSYLINKGLEKKWEKDLIINYVKNNFSKEIIEKKYLEIY